MKTGRSTLPAQSASGDAQSARVQGTAQSFLPALQPTAKPQTVSAYQTTNNQASIAASSARGPRGRSQQQQRQGQGAKSQQMVGGGAGMPKLMNTSPPRSQRSSMVGTAGQKKQKQELGASTVEEAAVLMLERNREAMSKQHPTEALVLLVQAEELGIHFAKGGASGYPASSAGSDGVTILQVAHPPGPLHEMLLLSAMTSHNLRTILIKMGDWSQGLKAGLKAVDLDAQLLDRALHNQSNNYGGLGGLTRQNPKDQRTVFGATMALASSHLQVSTMHSKLGRHEASLGAAKNCVESLTVYIEQVGGATGPEGICTELAALNNTRDHHGAHHRGARGGSMEDHPVILLAAAQYNLSVELEHCGDIPTALIAMHIAEKYSAMAMPVDHPLRLRIQQAAAAQQQSTQKQVAGKGSMRGRPNTSEEPGGSNRQQQQAGGAGGGKVLRPNSQGMEPLPPKNLPKLEFSSVAVIPDLGGGGGMVPLHSRRPQEEKHIAQQAGTSLDVTAALRNQRLSLNSGTVPPAQPPLAGQSHQLHSTNNSQRDRPASQQQQQSSNRAGGGDGAQSPQKAEKLAEMKENYQNWLTASTDNVFNDYSHRHYAALRIQCSWRCTKAKIECHNRRQILYHFLHQEQVAAVRCIVGNLQAKIRHRKFREGKIQRAEEAAARARLEAGMRKAVTKVIFFLRAAIARRKRNADIMRRLALEHEEKLKQYDTAAYIIQRWWPIILSEKNHWRQRSIELAEQKAIEADRQKQSLAATDITRVWRGRDGRKYAKNYKREKLAAEARKRRVVSESIDAIRTILREYRHRLLRLDHAKLKKGKDEATAVAKIEAEWQGCLERRAMKFINGRARMMQQSAAVCQRCYRSYRARRELRVLRVMTKVTDEARLEKEGKRDDAALRIQCWYRMVRAKKIRRMLLAGRGWKLISALWTLQRVGRAYEGRKLVTLADQFAKQLYQQAIDAANLKRHNLVSNIQAFGRAIVSEKVKNRLIHREEYEELYVYHRMHYERKRDAAATKIQSQVRKRQAVQRASKRRQIIHDQMTYVVRQTVKLQCFWRMILAKRQLQGKQVEAMKRKEKKREFELVQNELFAWRANELDGLQELQRAGLEEKEDQSWAYLLALSMAIPTTAAPAIKAAPGGGGGGYPDRSGGGDGDGDEGAPHTGGQGHQLGSQQVPDDDETDDDEEGIYD